MNPRGYGCLIFDKVTKNRHWGRDNIFNNGDWESEQRIMKQYPCPTSSPKFTSNWIKGINKKPKNSYFLKGNPFNIQVYSRLS